MIRAPAIIAIVTATATALALSSATASARPRRTTWLACPADQSSGGHLVIENTASGGLLTVSGRVDPCAPPRGTDAYTIAAYVQGDAYLATWVDGNTFSAWYADYAPGRPSTFTARIGVGAPETQAICLVTGAQTRLQCYEYSLTGGSDDSPVIGPAIPVTDPRVQLDAPLPPPSATGPPSCGSCW